MNLRSTGRIAVAGLALTAALGLTACGSDSPKETPKKTPASTSAKPDPNLPPVPTAADLNAELKRALDPAVPNSEKLDMVQGAQADPDLPNKFAEAYKQTNAQAEVTKVTPFGDTLDAQVKFTVNGQENTGDITFVAENGKWKVAQSWVCAGLKNFNVQSPACP
ncbi:MULTISPECIES: hypothetical protein [unclassified Nocardia]|uniref:hypothetical protein n=1 Tax=unclassified Nocardia TaxID=2637762 RepID=UPI001CE3FC07|nr:MULTISPECIES: hypothetical protein [unclassified Nocardia]